MAEFQDLLDFPPAPKLNVLGKLDPAKATESETRGQELFFGKAQCATCHPAPYYTDNSMHNLKVDRFYQTQPINGMVATAQGPIKTFPLRGIKESPPYFHDGRLLTLEDTVEFFNIVQELKLTSQEKADLAAFLAVTCGPDGEDPACEWAPHEDCATEERAAAAEVLEESGVPAVEVRE